MLAFGIGTPIFLVVQALISWFVYSEAKKYGSRSPVVVGASVFVLGVGLAFVFSTVIELVVVELLVILIYLLGVHAAKRRSASA
ncbi:sporulation control protein (plasmid) [Halogeometricum borinquense DSM 11551]|uniref:Sporulation control protein n=1 Tax=Halogeometricum borinquense (strain ATCC 700274 / DSM 11551 / JCM 10706 / KCTC 4070 / PR3) TaxID=469382 RepID=E4NVZ7_HALBP|nr:sporulation control protein [Halogeometricum borinquense DSM 11551]